MGQMIVRLIFNNMASTAISDLPPKVTKALREGRVTHTLEIMGMPARI
jgi:hypothetical protein